MDVVSGLALAVTTTLVVVGGGVIVGFVALFRRRGDSGIRRLGPTDLGSLSSRAGTLLVRMDDAVRQADEELGYAIAQFGPQKARAYGDAVTEARLKVVEAFRLRQALDDATPDSARETREWTLQIIALCEQAEKVLAAQDAAFTSLRHLEVNATTTLADVRSRIAAARARVSVARSTLDQLGQRYAASTIAPVAGNADAAEEALAAASSSADTAEPGISQSGVNAVSETLEKAAGEARRADGLLDAIERMAGDLESADGALAKLRATTADDLAEAKRERDSAPDADSGQAIIAAMAQVESALLAPAGPSDPVAELDRIGAAVAQLDLALASARNQASRLEHARAAYEGTLVSAQSQISAVQDYIAAHGASVAARTRLAEAQRQFVIATAETDPVEALDAIRRAVTHARDADALARF